MNVRSFAVFLIIAGTLGLAGSFFYFFSGSSGFGAEKDREMQLRISRVNSGGWGANRQTDSEIAGIEGAKSDRIAGGKMAMMVFAGVSLLGFGIYISTKPAPEPQISSLLERTVPKTALSNKPSETSVADQLAALHRLHSLGQLSDEEYSKAKQRTLT